MTTAAANKPAAMRQEIARLRAQLQAVTEERDRLAEALKPFVDTYSATDIVYELKPEARANLHRAQQALSTVSKE